MNKIIQFGAFSVLFLMSSISCTKILDLDPVSQISNNSFWKTEDDAKGSLYAMYDKLRTEAASNLYLFGEARSELMNTSLGEVGFFGKYFRNELSQVNMDRTWLNAFTIVHDANLILKYVPAIPFKSEPEKTGSLPRRIPHVHLYISNW